MSLVKSFFSEPTAHLGSNPLMLLVVIMGAIKSSSIIISVSSSPVYDDVDFVGD